MRVIFSTAGRQSPLKAENEMATFFEKKTGKKKNRPADENLL